MSVAKRILIAEDDHAVRELLLAILQNLGAEIETAADGLSAIKALRKFKPHLVVLDVMMPHFDGFEICYRIQRGEFGTPPPKIMVVTVRASPEDRAIATARKVDAYLTKPFQPEEVREWAGRLLAEADKERPQAEV